MKTILTFTLVLMLGTSVFTQSDMTRDDAVSLINQKLSELKGVKHNAEPRAFVRSSIQAEGGKLKLSTVFNGTSTVPPLPYLETYVFDPSEITTIDIVSQPGNTVDFVNVDFSAKSVTSFYGGGPSDPSVDPDASVDSMDYLLLYYAKGDGTNGTKLVNALSRLKALSTTGAKPDGPSLEDTLAFLKAKIDGSGVTYSDTINVGTTTYKQTHSVKASTRAVLSLETNIDRRFVNKSVPDVLNTENCRQTVRFNFADLIPSSVDVKALDGFFSVVYKLTDGKKIDVVSRCTTVGPLIANSSGTVKLNGFGILISDRETAEKVAKALAHAVKLNGGKEELF